MLTLERRTEQADKTVVAGPAMITPAVDEDYWSYRVKLSDTQAVVGFPKFGTVGIGFAQEEEDWNTNLPYTCTTEEIARHIMRNKGDESITTFDVVCAISMIQDAVREDHRG